MSKHGKSSLLLAFFWVLFGLYIFIADKDFKTAMPVFCLSTTFLVLAKVEAMYAILKAEGE